MEEKAVQGLQAILENTVCLVPATGIKQVSQFKKWARVWTNISSKIRKWQTHENMLNIISHWEDIN